MQYMPVIRVGTGLGDGRSVPSHYLIQCLPAALIDPKKKVRQILIQKTQI